MSNLAKLIGKPAYAAMQGDPVLFVRAFDREPWPFQKDILHEVATRREDGKFAHRLACISMPRQNSKTTMSCWVALWRLYCDPEPQEIVSVALDREGARIILDDARRIIRNSDVLYSLLDADGLTRSEIRLAEDGGRWVIKSGDAVFSRGLRPSTVCYDELGWTADQGDLFNVLSAGQAAQPNPLIVVTSTVGPVQAGPLWEIFQAAERKDPGILLIYRTENDSPLVTQEHLEHQQSLLPAPVFAREHLNQWGSGTDAYCTDEDWKRATASGDPRRDFDYGPCSCFADLGWSHDESAVAISKREGQQVSILAIETFQGTKADPVRFEEVRARLRYLAEHYHVENTVIESPQGVGMAQQLKSEGVRCDVLYPTVESNRERWGWLYTALKNGGVRLPNDPKLRRQLLTLTIRTTPTGWRVEDVPGVHNDRAVACAGAGFMAAARLGVSAEDLERYARCEIDISRLDEDMIAYMKAKGVDVANPSLATLRTPVQPGKSAGDLICEMREKARLT